MKKFMFLYTGGGGGTHGAPPTEAQMADIMKRWQAWLGSLGDVLVDGGNPFGSDVKNIVSNGAVSDGPVGVQATGYTLVAAESLDQAVKVAQGCPGLDDGADITVYEVLDVM
jgi:hypothetical protein